MKNKLFLFALIAVLSCSKNENAQTIAPENTAAQNTTDLIPPNKTDANYASAQESHYIVRTTKPKLDKLFLFIGGSYSKPKDYNFICDHAASLGLDVISLSYPNEVAAFSMANNPDPNGFADFREEICFGNQTSSVVDVSVLNCILTRATQLLIYLKNTFPNENWGRYLSATNTILWSNVVLSGHSQGSGHACYLAKKYLTDRVLLFSGPNDYSTYFTNPANWLSQTSRTPINKYYALLHTQDEIVPFAYQVENLRSLGLLKATENPVLADNLTTPYPNAHAMAINTSALSYHNSTVGANPKIAAIWTYMLGAN